MMTKSRPVKCWDTYEVEIVVSSEGQKIGAVRVPDELLADAYPEEGIRTWEGVMKPARKKGDKQMWRLMEPRSPDVEKRLWMADLKRRIVAQYGPDAWDSPPQKPLPIAPSIHGGKVVEYDAVWDKDRDEWRWVPRRVWPS